MTENFKTYAKWILSGEHAVVRGGPALVFPLKKYSLSLSYIPSSSLEITGNDVMAQKILQETLIYAYSKYTNFSKSVTGKFNFENTIPSGQGLGFSAAVSTIIGQWLEQNHLNLLFHGIELYRAIENKFHGQSSGVDIVGVSSELGLYYKITEKSVPLKIKWQPKIFLSFTGKNSSTKVCIEKVNKMWEFHQKKAQILQERMIKSVQLCQQALSCDEKEGLMMLIEGIKIANSCFTEWGLDPDSDTEKLLEMGACAAKPTGSGGGGGIISVWLIKPPPQFQGIFLNII